MSLTHRLRLWSFMSKRPESDFDSFTSTMNDSNYLKMPSTPLPWFITRIVFIHNIYNINKFCILIILKNFTFSQLHFWARSLILPQSFIFSKPAFLILFNCVENLDFCGSCQYTNRAKECIIIAIKYERNKV